MKGQIQRIFLIALCLLTHSLARAQETRIIEILMARGEFLAVPEILSWIPGTQVVSLENFAGDSQKIIMADGDKKVSAFIKEKEKNCRKLSGRFEYTVIGPSAKNPTWVLPGPQIILLGPMAADIVAPLIAAGVVAPLVPPYYVSHEFGTVRTTCIAPQKNNAVVVGLTPAQESKYKNVAETTHNQMAQVVKELHAQMGRGAGTSD